MAQLKYKTRGQMDPRGKPKVYFCCHPMDFSPYFGSISEDILKISNCSIRYDEKPDRGKVSFVRLFAWEICACRWWGGVCRHKKETPHF